MLKGERSRRTLSEWLVSQTAKKAIREKGRNTASRKIDEPASSCVIKASPEPESADENSAVAGAFAAKCCESWLVRKGRKAVPATIALSLSSKS